MSFPLAITGHRPSKLGGYNDCPLHRAIKTEICRVFCIVRDRHPEGVLLYSGMALGVDQWAAAIALDLGFEVHAAIPCDGQDSQWPTFSQETYRNLLSRCTACTNVSPGPYAGWKMQARNQFMVDRSKAVLAVWDGTSGGTANCINYARSKGKPVKVLMPSRLLISR